MTLKKSNSNASSFFRKSSSTTNHLSTYEDDVEHIVDIPDLDERMCPTYYQLVEKKT